MDEYDTQKVIAKDIYGKIGTVFCPTLNDNIRFTRAGFDHLTSKYGKSRPRKEQIERFALIPFLTGWVMDPKADTHLDDKKAVNYWTLIPSGCKEARVVITENSLNQKIFWSVYLYQKQKTSRK